jgi:hypothetical protein
MLISEGERWASRTCHGLIEQLVDETRGISLVKERPDFINIHQVKELLDCVAAVPQVLAGPRSISLLLHRSIADLVTYWVDMPDIIPVEKEGSSVGLLPYWEAGQDRRYVSFGAFDCHNRRRIGRCKLRCIDRHVRRAHVP